MVADGFVSGGGANAQHGKRDREVKILTMCFTRLELVDDLHRP